LIALVSGSEKFLTRRAVRGFVDTANLKHSTVLYVDGSSRGELSQTLGGSCLFPNPTLLVVSNPDKLDPQIVLEHQKDKDSLVDLLLVYDGVLRKNSKFRKALGSKVKHFEYVAEKKAYKQKEFAEAFCMAEAKKLKKSFKPEFASALVQRVGSDLGVLSFELLKAALLSDAEGKDSIEAEHLRKVIAPLLESSVFELTDALGDFDLKRTLRTLTKIQTTHNGDPTVKVCSIIENTVVNWACAESLYEKKTQIEKIADQIGLDPWYCKNLVMPVVVRWSSRGKLVDLLIAVTESKRAALKGALNPWVGFSSRITQVLTA
jgi:DNA polymerase III delta subunit